MTNKEFYKERIRHLDAQVVTLTKQHARLTTLRLFTFLVVILSIYLLTQGFSFVWLILSLAAFVITLIRDWRISESLKRFKALKQLNKDELKSEETLSHAVFSNGSEYINPHHPFTYDIDIFGEGSLFKSLNRTVTPEGKANLSAGLKNINKEPEHILARQEAIKELSKKSKLIQDFMVDSYLYPDIPNEDLEDLLNLELLSSIKSHKTTHELMLFGFPFLFLTSVALSVFSYVHVNVPVILFLINLFVVSFYIKRINAYHKVIDVLSKNLKRMLRLISAFKDEKCSAALLCDITDDLIHKHHSAHRKILQSEKLLNAFENRLNFIVAVVLNGIYLRDLWLVFRFNKWLKENKQLVPVWIKKVAELDELISLANYNFNHSDFSFPDPKGEAFIAAENLGHPLIPSEKRVDNNFELSQTGEIYIVTGANMSGKSTFLRTALINLVLASTGSGVCARKFSYKPASIFSSIRTFDNLIDDVSYFQAELIRLKAMMEEAQKGLPVVIAIDEPLKGTNSEDKRSGSLLLLKKMIALPVCGLVATHDLELQQLAHEDSRFKLICFELRFDHDKVIYDYTLRSGVTETMNATILMKNMNLI